VRGLRSVQIDDTKTRSEGVLIEKNTSTSIEVIHLLADTANPRSNMFRGG
jgi:hypothetical protein